MTPRRKAKRFLLTKNYEEMDFQFQHLKNTMEAIDIALEEQAKQIFDECLIEELEFIFDEQGCYLSTRKLIRLKIFIKDLKDIKKKYLKQTRGEDDT